MSATDPHDHLRELSVPEKLAIAEEVERALAAALSPIIDRFAQQIEICPCCVSRAMVGGMAKVLGWHAAAATGDEDDVAKFLSLVAQYVLLGISDRRLTTGRVQ